MARHKVISNSSPHRLRSAPVPSADANERVRSPEEFALRSPAHLAETIGAKAADLVELYRHGQAVGGDHVIPFRLVPTETLAAVYELAAEEPPIWRYSAVPSLDEVDNIGR